MNLKNWHEYTCVTLDKVATISKPLGGGKTVIWTCKHSELAEQLKNEKYVTFDYCYGQEKRRLKQIKEMGFDWALTVWRNTDEKYSRIKQIWVESETLAYMLEDDELPLTDEDIAEWQGRY